MNQINIYMMLIGIIMISIITGIFSRNLYVENMGCNNNNNISNTSNINLVNYIFYSIRYISIIIIIGGIKLILILILVSYLFIVKLYYYNNNVNVIIDIISLSNINICIIMLINILIISIHIYFISIYIYKEVTYNFINNCKVLSISISIGISLILIYLYLYVYKEVKVHYYNIICTNYYTNLFIIILVMFLLLFILYNILCNVLCIIYTYFKHALPLQILYTNNILNLFYLFYSFICNIRYILGFYSLNYNWLMLNIDNSFPIINISRKKISNYIINKSYNRIRFIFFIEVINIIYINTNNNYANIKIRIYNYTNTYIISGYIAGHYIDMFNNNIASNIVGYYIGYKNNTININDIIFIDKSKLGIDNYINNNSISNIDLYQQVVINNNSNSNSNFSISNHNYKYIMNLINSKNYNIINNNTELLSLYNNIILYKNKINVK